MSNLSLLAATGASGGISFIIIIVVWIAVMYFLLIRPQKKQSQQQDDMIKALKPGDSIMTTSGFYGTVIGIPDDDTVIVEFGNNKNCRIPMHKKAIAEVEKSGASVAETTETKKEVEAEEKKGLLGKKK